MSIENNLKLCDYGCGRIGIHQFKNGRFCCCKISTSCPKIKEKKINNQNKAEVKKKISESKIGNKNPMKNPKVAAKNAESRRKNGTSGLGVPKSKEHKKNLSVANKGQIPWCKGKKNIFSEETIKKKSLYMLNGGSRKANLQKHGYIIEDKDRQDRDLYQRLVWRFTDISMKKKYTREELKQRGHKKENNDKNIDHIFSIHEGFKLGVLPRIVGSESNIKLVSCSYNKSKNSKSDIKIDELFDLYKKESNSSLIGNK